MQLTNYNQIDGFPSGREYFVQRYHEKDARILRARNSWTPSMDAALYQKMANVTDDHKEQAKTAVITTSVHFQALCQDGEDPSKAAKESLQKSHMPFHWHERTIDMDIADFMQSSKEIATTSVRCLADALEGIRSSMGESTQIIAGKYLISSVENNLVDHADLCEHGSVEKGHKAREAYLASLTQDKELRSAKRRFTQRQQWRRNVLHSE